MNISFEANFHRRLIFSNVQFTGRYKYKNIVQLLKADDGLLIHPSGLMYIKPIVLEFNSNIYTYYNRLYDKSLNLEETFRSNDFAKELIAHLSLVFNVNFFFEKRYKCLKEELGEDYFIPSFTQSDNYPDLLVNDEYIFKAHNYLGDEVVKPSFIDRYFDNYFNLADDVKHRYNMSLMLYYNAIDIREISPSMSYVALISAIENLFEYEGELTGFKPEICAVCKTPQYKSTRRFKNFMMEYYPVDNPKYNKYLNEIYSRRSKIAHAGKLHYNDYADTELDIDGNREVSDLKRIVRVALVNWILKYT